MSNKISTIQISRNTKKKLDNIKIHPRETYEDIIIRLLKKAKEN